MSSEAVETSGSPAMDQPSADPPLSWREKLSYGGGEVANNLSWTMVGGFLLYYYTNVAMLPVAALGTLMFVARCLDALIDPFVGLVVDRTHSRLGRARPYVLLGSIPLSLFAVLTFTSPAGSTTAKLLFAYLTFLVLGAVYSIVNIPYGALLPMMTKDSREKVQLGSLRSAGSSVGAVAVTSLVTPMVAHLGHGNAQRGFTLTAIIFAIAGMLLYTLLFFNVKERYVDFMIHKPLSMKESLKQVLHNEPFIVSELFTFVHLVRIGCILTLTVYFSLLVLKAPWTIPFLFGAMSVGSVVAASMATPYFQRLGFRKGNSLALLFALVCYMVLPFVESHPVLFLTTFCAACLGAQACTTAVFAMVANASDYHEFKFRSRCDGLIFSCVSFSTKVGIALGASMIAFGLASVHYNAAAVTAQSVQAIRLMFYLFPGALMVLQIVIVLFYRLDTKHTLIVKTTRERA